MEKNKNLLVIALVCIVFILSISSVILYLKYENLEDKYDDDRLYNNSNNNSSNNDINNNNDNNNDQGYIGNSKALDIALGNLNITQNDIADLSIDLDYKYNTTVYEIEFKYNRYEYEYYINANTGDILRSFKEWD